MSLSETQEQILDAVRAVIVRDGIDGASMRSMAEEADVSVGLLSYHFDDKETLITAAFEQATERLLESSIAAADADDDPLQRVSSYLRGAFSDEFLDSEYLTLRISLWAVARTDDAIAAVERRLYRRYADHLGAMIQHACPDISAAEVEDRVTDVNNITNGLWLDWARTQDERALERGLRFCEAIATEGR